MREAMMEKLLIDMAEHWVHDYFLERDRTTIGRSSKNQLILNDKRVSSVHAAIIKEDEGTVLIDLEGKRDLLFSRHLACTNCGVSVPELAPRMFSFNSPYGACPACDGIGVKKSFSASRILVDPSLPAPDEREGTGSLTIAVVGFENTEGQALVNVYRRPLVGVPPVVASNGRTPRMPLSYPAQDSGESP